MNSKLIVLLGILLASTTCILAQTEDQKEVVTETENANTEEQNLEEQEESQQAFRKRINDLYIACILATRYQLESLDNELTPLLNSIDDLPHRIALYKKIVADHIYHCGISGTQVPSVSTDIMSQIKEGTYKVEEWDILFTDINFGNYKNADYSVTLNETEQSIMKFVESFDNSMKKEGKQKSEPKIGHMSLNSIPLSGQIFYFILIIGLFSALIFYGYTKIGEDSTLKQKNKKDKKKDK